MFIKGLTREFLGSQLFKQSFVSLFAGLFLFTAGGALAQPRLENTLKFGALYFSTIDSYLSVTNKTTNAEALNSNSLDGVLIYVEKISNSYFGYEFRGGPLQQQIVMQIDSIDSDVQTTSLYLGGSMRAYLKSHKRRGMNIYGAVNLGLLTTNISFIIAPPVALEGKDYTTTSYIVGVEGGFDYLLRFAGVRVAGGYQYGGNTIKGTDDDLYRLRYLVDSLYWSLGVFSFF